MDRLPGRLYALLAAEPSGDMQAAALVEHIRRRDPEARFLGLGGRHLREAGVELIFDTSTWGTIGPFEVIAKLPRLIAAYLELKKRILAERPDVCLMVDSPAVFMRLASATREAGIRTVYYFPPSAWSDSEKRARQILDRVTEVVCGFERQFATYERAGLKAHYFGHPMVDLVPRREREEALGLLDLREGRYVALMPGSRVQEVRLMTPVFIEAARLLKAEHPDLQFLVPAATEPVYEMLQGLLEGTGIDLFLGRAQELLAVAEVAIVTSGSVTLEAAYLDCPMVLGYRFNAFDYALAMFLIRIGVLNVPRFSLPNLVLDETIVPELLQDQVTPARLAEEARKLLVGGSDRGRLQADLARVRERLGPSPVVSRVADLVVDVALRGEGTE